MKTVRERSSGTQRRVAPRIVSQLPITVGGKAGVTRDISATGVCFEFDEPHEVGSKIEFLISLETPGGLLNVRCQGEVARVEKSDGKVKVAAKILSQDIEVPNQKLVLKEFPGDEL